ncbi:MAG: four helix bundle protein [Akkermansiaceae bacterium]|nr:four helix bundle protein [Akkermansiaceae bacterium]
MKRNTKPYVLEGRTFQFALSVRLFLRQHKWDPVSWSDVTQVLRSSGSVAANFVEANESISIDDKLYRLRLCRKEAKESSLWLRLIEETNPTTKEQAEVFLQLTQETSELVKILHTIINNKTQQISTTK